MLEQLILESADAINYIF